ncbi:ejaculatory bulb-specific protein 3-like [Belonocnema kinseyi]|uniref:ejaculatory bulb-specific protein 3-like n=1 Tax=Belonocnema kinseyi TaxID=2817044 RepID=UPI00143DCCB7|nr:ejaculatory bulb-specific protein 3-like [Belonocnema kinseyi]
MKIVLSLTILCIGLRAISSAEFYSTVFDTIDVDTILSNKRLTDQYIACLLDQGVCTADGRGLRRLLPEAIATLCEKCTTIQKRNARKVLRYIKERRPEVWDLFVQKYDPTGQYMQNFEYFISGVDDSSSYY